MAAIRVSASLIVASALTGFSAASGLLAAPIAHADPLDNIRASVVTTRANAGCPPLNYNAQLEAAAQATARGTADGGNSGGYVGATTEADNGEDDAQDSINRVNVALDATLHDCSWKDFGVGFYRDPRVDKSVVVVYVGQPPAPVPANNPAPANNSSPPNNATSGGGDAKPVEPPPPPKDGVAVNVDQSNPLQVAVTVTNTSPLDGKCTYDAKKTDGLIGTAEVKKDFSLAAGADTTLTFKPAVPLGTTYHVVVSCHGTFNGQDDEFGHFEQDVSGTLG